MLPAIIISLTLAAPSRIHSVSDISHEFTFYMDGRFFQQYVGDRNGADARNWGTLRKLDLTNTNLLALASGSGPVRYDPRSIAHARRFAEAGGVVLVMSDALGLRADSQLPIQEVARAFGASFVPDEAVAPYKALASLGAGAVEARRSGSLKLGPEWDVLVSDSRGAPMMAQRSVGKGFALIAVRGLFGQRPDASDPINAAWITPLLQRLVANRPVDASKPPKGQWAELTRDLGGLTVEYNEGTRTYADAIAREYFVVRKHLEEITGVPPSKGTLTHLLMLPTGGGGFSSGDRIGIGAWWGDYPKNRYPMIELIAHEAGHSWVLPHAEPVWNEPIATYLGILVGRRMGMPEADQTLRRTVEAARKLDSGFTNVAITAEGAPRDVVWGKTFWLFEELERLHGPGTMARYFGAKRKLVPAGRSGYTMDDCVAVWSAALGRDLFGWFTGYGVEARADRTSVNWRSIPN
jgi:hypothetical protein